MMGEGGKHSKTKNSSKTLPYLCSNVSEIQAANLTLTHYKTLRLKYTPSPDLYGVAVVIINDTASDTYWARSSGGQKIST
jgi:hypothetical protein